MNKFRNNYFNVVTVAHSFEEVMSLVDNKAIFDKYVMTETCLLIEQLCRTYFIVYIRLSYYLYVMWFVINIQQYFDKLTNSYIFLIDYMLPSLLSFTFMYNNIEEINI